MSHCGISPVATHFFEYYFSILVIFIRSVILGLRNFAILQKISENIICLSFGDYFITYAVADRLKSTKLLSHHLENLPA